MLRRQANTTSGKGRSCQLAAEPANGGFGLRQGHVSGLCMVDSKRATAATRSHAYLTLELLPIPQSPANWRNLLLDRLHRVDDQILAPATASELHPDGLGAAG